GYYGYRTFSELLEDAQKEGLLTLDKHKSSGMYVVTRFGLEMKNNAPSGTTPAPEARREGRAAGGDERRTRGRRGSGRGRSRDAAPAPAAPQAPAPSLMDDDAYDADADRPMGKALFAELDVAQENEVPSYRPRLAIPAAAKPAEPAETPPERAA